MGNQDPPELIKDTQEQPLPLQRGKLSSNCRHWEARDAPACL